MSDNAESDRGKWWIGNDDRDPLLPAEKDAPYRALLGLMLENVHIGVSNEGIVVDTQWFPAPADLRAALVTLMDEWVDGEATHPIPPGATEPGEQS